MTARFGLAAVLITSLAACTPAVRHDYPDGATLNGTTLILHWNDGGPDCTLPAPPDKQNRKAEFWDFTPPVCPNRDQITLIRVSRAFTWSEIIEAAHHARKPPAYSAALAMRNQPDDLNWAYVEYQTGDNYATYTPTSDFISAYDRQTAQRQ